MLHEANVASAAVGAEGCCHYPCPAGETSYRRRVDSRDDIREFLASRRARITPETAGLPNYGGSRRVPGLRRAEVALLAGVSPDYYVRLERGNLSGVSDSFLEAIACALRLDEAERSHLYDLARAAKHGPRYRRATKPQIRPA